MNSSISVYLHINTVINTVNNDLLELPNVPRHLKMSCRDSIEYILYYIWDLQL